MSLALKWTFPPTGGGVAQGFNDSAQEHFRKNAWKNAIRELVQNSLDAVRDEGRPVTVEISKLMVPPPEIGAADLAGHVRAAQRRTGAQNEAAGERFYARALDILGGDAIETLAITDSNTTGLVGEKWDAMVYSEGTTHKGGMGAAGGSFGLGKNAPYLVSDLKTVCYSTRYLKRGRQEDFIARCKLVAHEDPAGRNGELQHMGFGTKARARAGRRVPPTRGRDVYREFRLRQAGSGIFIAGFNPLTEDWQAVAESSIAESFFAAVHEKRLRVRIGPRWITHETLDGIFERDQKNRSLHYYRILRSPDAARAEVGGDLGRLVLGFSTGEDDSPNRIAYVNRRGMLITDAGRPSANPFHTTLGSGWARYAAVVCAADDKTDKKIREMEPPNHRAIEYERIIDPIRREKTRRELAVARGDIARIIGDALRDTIKDQEINVSELADVMGIDDEGGAGGGDGQGAGETAAALQTRRIATSGPGRAAVAGDDSDKDEEGGGGGGGKPKAGRGSGDGHGAKRQEPASALLEKVRILRVDGRLRVAFTPRSGAEDVLLLIRPAGEAYMRERPIRVAGASVLRGGASAGIEGGGRVAVSHLGHERVTLDLTVGGGEAKGYTGYEIACVQAGEKP